jgi:glycerophosphoryl diester phosphodiesterase
MMVLVGGSILLACLPAVALAGDGFATPRCRHDPGPITSAKLAPWVIAHRGASADAPENTLASFRKAIRDGADVLELDCQRTADGRLIVLHDLKLDRTTDGKGGVGDKTLAQLRRLDAGSWKGPQFKGERLATLEEVSALAREAGVGMIVEAKTPYVLDPDLAKEIVRVVEHAGMLPSTVIQQFDHRPLAVLHALRPDVMTAPLVDAGIDQIGPIVRSTGAFAYLPGYEYILPDRVRFAHSLGVKVCPWTVDDPDHMRKLIEAGVDGIMTNKTALLVEVIRQLGLEKRPWPR